MLCYASIARIPADEIAVLTRACRKHLDAFVTSSDTWDRVFVQACTVGELGRHIDDVLAFLRNHGYSPDVVGVDSQGQPNSTPFWPCAETGQYFPHSQMCLTPGTPSRRVCREWFTANYFCCPQCRRHYLTSEAMNVPGNNRYCRSCHDRYCRQCVECDTPHFDHDMYYDESADEHICFTCRDRMRGEEFGGNEREFSARNSFGSSRRYGIELETNRGMASNNFAFANKEDGSVDGWEFVSHVLRGDEGLQEIERFMASGHNIRVGDNCGFHLHMNIKDLSSDEQYAVYAAFLVTQHWWFNRVQPHRIGNSYCRQLNDRSFLDVKTALVQGRTFESYCNNYERYFWMNTSALHKHGTFENRLHHATWNFAEVKGWIIMNLRFVRAARELRVEQTDTLATFKAKADQALAFALEYFSESLPNVQSLQLATA